MSMARALVTARALFVHSLAQATAYRAAIVIWMLSGMLPLLMMFVWMGLAKDGPIAGYGPTEFATYFLLVFFVRQMTKVAVVWDLDREIRLGDLSPKLLRPLDPVWQHAIHNLAERVVNFVVAVPPIALGLWLAGAWSLLEPSAIPGFAAALAGAWLLHFIRQYAFGLLAFWTDQAVALENAWFVLYIALGGGLAPIDLLPESLQGVAFHLPFAYTIDFPVRVLMGKVSGSALYFGLAAQAGWIVGFVILQRVLWWRGLRRYGAVGA